jgi:hypothetical protein
MTGLWGDGKSGLCRQEKRCMCPVRMVIDHNRVQLSAACVLCISWMMMLNFPTRLLHRGGK